MAKIIDPDKLNRDVEIVINTSTKKIKLNVDGNLTDDGITLQCLYSYTKEIWLSDPEIPKFLPPFDPITDEQFDMKNGWNFEDQSTINLIRDSGWALKDENGISLEEYMNITTLGKFENPSTDKAYYIQNVDSTSTLDIVQPGEVNQAIKIYGDSDHGNIDFRSFFKIFIREEGKEYGEYDLLKEQELSTLTYRKYALPLSNATDIKITHSDTEIESDDAYENIKIAFHETSVKRNIGGTEYDFNIIIDGNDKKAEIIYEKIQYMLRKNSNINSQLPTVWGTTSKELLRFIGDMLCTGKGVYIDNFNASDTNRIEFTDTSGIGRSFP